VAANKKRKLKTPTTEEGAENQLISLAFDLVKKQLEDGSASSAVLTHFLKLASRREKLEQTRLENENLLLAAKVEAMASAKRIEELYENALNAMRRYAGEPSGDDDASY
jgi:hypothetical protein